MLVSVDEVIFLRGAYFNFGAGVWEHKTGPSRVVSNDSKSSRYILIIRAT